MREKYSWKGLGRVPPPIALKDRVSLFESLETTEFVLLLIPPMAACLVLIKVSADVFQQQETKNESSVAGGAIAKTI